MEELGGVESPVYIMITLEIILDTQGFGILQLILQVIIQMYVIPMTIFFTFVPFVLRINNIRLCEELDIDYLCNGIMHNANYMHKRSVDSYCPRYGN